MTRSRGTSRASHTPPAIPLTATRPPWAVDREDLVVEVLHAGDTGRDVVGTRGRTRRFGKRSAPVGVGEQRADGRGEGVLVPGRNQKGGAPVLENLRAAVDRRGNDGLSRGHGLEQGE